MHNLSKLLKFFAFKSCLLNTGPGATPGYIQTLLNLLFFTQKYLNCTQEIHKVARANSL